ncbi:SRPBCC family protein [Sediminicola luteus]|uniref:Cell division inhibitor n=1 Tax=Sediminicola luteus TaxID=319238 RepID=A0A2A4G5M1_9FLAO|nr:SRPBCC family protein [Sediminicola luteus]PCE63045.1 hypothetical protein B7P33_17380 [Sediminicola luteus]
MEEGVSITKHSGVYTLKAQQTIPLSMEKAWDFFKDPNNLSRITPPEMGFKITSSIDRMAYAGQIITYKIQVFPGIHVSWVTELTVVEAPHFFIDEQRFGPYAMWHHEHFFEDFGNETTLMHDKITYKMPLGILGDAVHELLVRKKLRAIFSFRRKIIDEILS